MNTSRTVRKVLLTPLLTFFALFNSSSAQDPPDTHTIAIRLPQTKTMHFDDAQKARDHLAAVVKLGCEARQQADAEHTDVTYRLAHWTEVTLTSEELVDQWEGWLLRAGFETIHGHEEAHAGDHPGKAVEYRSEKWLTKHFEQAAEAKEFLVVCKGLGCEIKQEIHDGHADIQFRSVAWKHLECPDHDVAHAREEWLKKLGFETKHED